MTARADERRASALARVRAVAAAAGVPGIVLTRPSSVAWAGAGINPPIDRTTPIDTVWLAVGPSDYTVITTKVEYPRVTAELVPAGTRVVAVDWYDGAAFVAAAEQALGAAAIELGSDANADFGVDVNDALVQSRLALSDAEQQDLVELAQDATVAVQDALRAWQPGETDFAVAARIAAACEQVGADAPCLLVGGDDRLAQFRHPVANGDRPVERVMAVLVARRGGLHVALTRYVAAHADTAFTADLARAQKIHVELLDAVSRGATFGSAMTALDAAYTRAGAPGEWANHYQGGPIGYGQREFEIAPVQEESPWFDEVITAGTALAYNPSLPGGLKDEDTYLVQSDGQLRWITCTSDWPTVTVSGRLRPAVLTID